LEQTQATRWGIQLGEKGIVDCDVHNVVPDVHALFPWLSDFWQEYVEQSGFKGPRDTAYPKAPTSALAGATPTGGGPPGSDLDLIRRHVLEAWDVEIAILSCAYAVESIHNPDADVALASATNDWQISEWLNRETRLRASVVVPSKQPDAAAREIERVGDHPGFVRVFLPVRSAIPYGKRFYHPIYEAATRRDLVVSFHFGGAPGNPPTSVGWPSHYLEEYAGMAQAFQGQLMSLIVEGVFDRFPTLRVAFVESGFTWLPPFLWRLDKEWKGLRREIPWTKRLPSEYVREHVRFSLQPIDGPPDPARLLRAIDRLGSDELLTFSTDYPHWQFDAPEEAVPTGLPTDVRRKILVDNARTFYRLTK
jgi:predicted TIM-barrel fold metal-dependent hydrolase